MRRRNLREQVDAIDDVAPEALGFGDPGNSALTPTTATGGSLDTIGLLCEA